MENFKKGKKRFKNGRKDLIPSLKNIILMSSSKLRIQIGGYRFN
jgi:hypothetical protein